MLLIEIVKFLILVATCEAMTMKQIRNTGKMMRKTCQPKNNVEDEKIDPIAEGIFIDEKEVKCYMACIMKMANTIKNGKLNFDAALKQADLLLPDEVKEPAKEAILACKKGGMYPNLQLAISHKTTDGHKDICDVSFHVTKCIYNQNPGIFYFP